LARKPGATGRERPQTDSFKDIKDFKDSNPADEVSCVPVFLYVLFPLARVDASTAGFHKKQQEILGQHAQPIEIHDLSNAKTAGV